MQRTPKLKLVSVTLGDRRFWYKASFEAEGLDGESSVQVSVSVGFTDGHRKYHPGITEIEEEALPKAKDLLRRLAQEEN